MSTQYQTMDQAPIHRVLSHIVEYKENGIQSQILVDKPERAMKLLAFDHSMQLKEQTAPMMYISLF